MSVFKTLFLSNHTKVLLKTQNPLYKSLPPSPPFIIRTLNSSPHKPTKKPLSLLFQDAVGLTENTGGNESQSESEGENIELLRELRKLEREVRKLKENPKGKNKEKEGVERGKPNKVKSLVELFRGEKEEEVERIVKVRREREEVVFKDFSQLAEIFVRHLYAKGYFNKANFLEDNKLDFGYFDNSYGRDFIKYAAFKFGKDHQEIAKWLSGNHLKKVVLFGCPSLDKNNVFAAKRLRKFFKIEENIVCSQCMLKDSCKYVNKSVWKAGTKNLLLVDVMKVITLYALDQMHPKLTVPDEVKDSVNQLLKEVIKLSQPT
ncbi:uncharacterized protein LOC110419281 [Herrania umbratica]|uniref:Uncharacterized protein LOC110419281 n=1 Tax=Herrania umbratica TaxID=108875 RepID=A0A6J1ALV6_9ROSI|nr:uncharacterized protein LOC110419281 [Herrania umbratica]